MRPGPALLLLFMIGIHVVVMTSMEPGSPARSRPIVASTLANRALVALYAFYRVPPPLIGFSITSVLMTWTYLRARRV